jgi:hypothetical protein
MATGMKDLPAALDPTAELYEKAATADRDIINRLIYEHLIHNCYSETAKSFSQTCQLGKGKATTTTTTTSSSSNSAAEPKSGVDRIVMDVDNKDGSNGSMNDGDMEIDDVEMESRNDKMPAGMATSIDTPPFMPPASDPLADKIAGSLKTLDARKHLYNLILAGNMTEAISFCNQVFPNALSGNSVASVDICFQLQCQQFIECVRTSAPEALQFAQDGGNPFLAASLSTRTFH